MIGIKAIAPYVEGAKISIQSLPHWGDLPDEESEYFASIGIQEVAVAKDQQAFSLARAASEKLLAENSIEPSALDLIIYIKSRLPQYLVASEATRLQAALGADQAMSYAISDLGCADMSMAIRQARDFLTANLHAEYVLICYGCKPSTPYRYRYPVTINGDGGLALLIARTEQNLLLDVEINVDGRFWDLFKLDFQNRLLEDFREELTNVRRYGFELAMESRNQFFNLNERILERNGLQKSQIRHFLLQNISCRAFQFYEEAYGIKISPVCSLNLRQYGHLGPADIFLNYFTALSNGLFKTDDHVLIMNNSPVAAWSSILIKV